MTKGIDGADHCTPDDGLRMTEHPYERFVRAPVTDFCQRICRGNGQLLVLGQRFYQSRHGAWIAYASERNGNGLTVVLIDIAQLLNQKIRHATTRTRQSNDRFLPHGRQ
jgi:hypothetical protein